MFIPSFKNTVQYGTITLAGFSTTGDYTLPIAVGIGVSAIVEVLGISFDTDDTGGVTYQSGAKLTFVDSTTIRATRHIPGGSAGAPTSVKFKVTDYISGFVKSLQDVVITMAGVGSNTATLSPSVNFSRSIYANGGFLITSSLGTEGVNGMPDQTLTNGTTATATRYSAIGTYVTQGQVLELNF